MQTSQVLVELGITPQQIRKLDNIHQIINGQNLTIAAQHERRNTTTDKGLLKSSEDLLALS